MHYILIVISFCITLQFAESESNEDSILNYTELAEKFGHKCEEFDVTTEDGYILKLFRIKGDETNPILLAHGIIASADIWLLRGNISLAITLANKGYDVWALNVRGNKYGKRHVTLNPNTDKSFWDYSFHEMGVKDLPANIDFILNKTKQTQLTIIGHSQGAQMSFVMASVLSEYNVKIKGIIGLAPIAFLNNVRFPLSVLMPLWLPINAVLKPIGYEAIFKNDSLLQNFTQKVCTQKDLGYEICGNAILFPVIGSDPTELEPDFFSFLFKYYPSTTSRKNIEHCAQNGLSKKFAQFDYGLKNIIKYGSLVPPEYSLAKITAPVALFVGLNDKLADSTDVKILRDRLPNSYYYEIKREQCNHLDVIWGRTMDEYLYPTLFQLLQKFTEK